MSELYGRRLPIVIANFGFGIFAIAIATAANVQTVMISRFFDGLFGSCPLTLVAAIFADIYSNETRGIAVAAFSATVFMGPLLAHFIGGFITMSHLGWRWTEYISSFMGFSAFILALFFLDETYPPLILVSKASELRRLTKNWGIHAKQEEIEVDMRELIVKNVGRPLRILFTEPIVLLISIYQGVYGMNAGVGSLPYFGLVIGELIAFVVVVLMNGSYVKKLQANNNVPVPEWRLPLVMAGGPIFAAGLFWFGWTGYTNRIPWIVPTLSGLFTGFGLFSIFLQLLNYIIDAYLMFAASAIAGNTFMRSLFGAIFPLFARYMYEGIGINYGQTLVGSIAVVLVPLPFVFYFYGRKIHAKSTFAPAPDIEQDKKRDEEKRVGSSGEPKIKEEG
jgi:DHA1 family multidrug resistance protein-like MFS transporter